MRETYGMVQAILHYRVYLIGAAFTVYTDHKPLVQWFSLVPNSETYARWMVKLQGLTFEVKYVEGEKNVLADLMSRPHDVVRSSLEEFHQALNAKAEQLYRNISSKAEANSLQLECNVTSLTSFFDEIKAEQTSEVLTDYALSEKEIEEIAGAYFYIKGEYPRLIVPKHLVNEVIAEAHKFGHYGHRRMMSLLTHFYFWPKMNKDVFTFVKYCVQCQ